jgi:MoaA/NifB/PqqE/SkfB family radical SAM enzyme
MCHYANSESPEYNLNHAGFMSLNLFKHILDTCPGKPVMSLTGGEPLLHQQIFEFIKELKSRGFYCTLTTNGWLLEAKAVQLCKSNLDLLVVSIDGERQTHDRIRSSGSYEKAVNGIQELLKQHDRPVVGISTVINDLNSKALENTYILAQNLGVDILNFNHLWIQTEKMIKAQDEVTDLHETGQVLWDVSTQSIDSDRIFKAIRSMHKKKHNFLLHAYPEMNREETGIYYNQPEELVKFGYSRCAWQVTRIYPDGEVGICREYHAGNVNDQPLREIWNNQKYRNFRKYLARNGTCPICSRCCLFFSRV